MVDDVEKRMKVEFVRWRLRKRKDIGGMDLATLYILSLP